MNSKFNKLLSNLPFTPSLIGQVAFYAKRLHKEESVRRIGVFFVLLAMAVQIFAIVSPPKPSLAASSNDLIFGGVHSVAELQNAYQSNNHGDIQRIFNYFGVGPAQLAQAREASVDSRGSNATKYYSMGRTIGGRTDSVQISIDGTTTPTYMRTLGGWAQKVWPAFSVPSTRVGQLWILKDCGNIVTIGLPPAGKPTLDIQKMSDPAPGSVVKPGQRIHYTMVFSNTGTGPARNFRVEDTVPTQLTNLQIGSSGAFEYVNGRDFVALWAPYGQPSTLGNSPQQYQVNFFATVRKDVSPGSFCNRATAKADETTVSSNQVCHIVRACPYNPRITPENPACKPPAVASAVCTDLNARLLSRTKVEFEAIANARNGAQIAGFEFDAGHGQKQTIAVGHLTGQVSKKFTHDYPSSPAPKTYTARITALTSLGNKTSSDCVQTITITKEKTPLVTIEKTVSTNGGVEGSTIKADPDQTFTFRFTVNNLGDADATNYNLPQDNITDVLEYADVAQLNGARLVKQTGDANSYLVWQPISVKARHTVVKTVSFTLKHDLPKTNSPASNPQSFDCRIQNSITTTTVTVDIDQANCITKVVEQASAQLPNTGPGATLVVGFSLTSIVSYFFFRNRLMAKELDLVRLDYAGNGGL